MRKKKTGGRQPPKRETSGTRPPPPLTFVETGVVKRSKQVFYPSTWPEVILVTVGSIKVPTNYHLAEELVRTGQAALCGKGDLHELTGIESGHVLCSNNSMYRFVRGGDGNHYHEVIVVTDMMDGFPLIMETLIREFVRRAEPGGSAWKRDGMTMTEIQLEGDALEKCLRQCMDPDFESPNDFFHPVKRDGRTNYYKFAFITWMFRNGVFPLGWKAGREGKGGRKDIWSTCTHFCFVAPVGSYAILDDGKRPIHDVQ
jgi:hypothetical protein